MDRFWAPELAKQACSCGGQYWRLQMPFAAAHESVSGTKRTWCDVRLESAFGGKAEVGFRDRQVSFLPGADIRPSRNLRSDPPQLATS